MSTTLDTIHAAVAAAREALLAAHPLPWDESLRATLRAQYLADPPTPARVALGMLLAAEDARPRHEAYQATLQAAQAAARATLPPRPWSKATIRRLVETYRSMPGSLERTALGRVLHEELTPPTPGAAH